MFESRFLFHGLRKVFVPLLSVVICTFSLSACVPVVVGEDGSIGVAGVAGGAGSAEGAGAAVSDSGTDADAAGEVSGAGSAAVSDSGTDADAAGNLTDGSAGDSDSIEEAAGDLSQDASDAGSVEEIFPAYEEITIDEGTDTKCEVSYTSCEDNIKEMFLSEGDKIAVIAASSRPGKTQIEQTIEGLKGWGFIPVEGKHIYDKEYTINEIIEDLKWALEDPETKAIFSIRGGYGASEIMDVFPLELIKKSNKLIIGYSDITVYSSAWSCVGLPSIHSCMSATFDYLPEECVKVEEALIKGSIPEYKCESNKYCKEGKADGILIGGNLSTFCSVLGTDYDITKTDEPYILFLEDVGEDLQHIHRYLTILKHYGVLDRASGIVFGEWTELPQDLGDYLGVTRGGEYESIADMISRQFLQDLDIPVAFGFPAGHGEVSYPLLMGEEAHISVDSDSYTITYGDK